MVVFVGFVSDYDVIGNTILETCMTFFLLSNIKDNLRNASVFFSYNKMSMGSHFASKYLLLQV